MHSVQIDLNEDLAALLNDVHDSLADAVEELMVLELYRRGTISSGKAGEILKMPRLAFIQRASAVGIPYIDMTDEEWAAERRVVEAL
jgi:predicted HTH domain antitoxin